MHVIRVLGRVGNGKVSGMTYGQPSFVKSAEISQFNPYHGHFEITSNVAQAMKFTSAAKAMEFYLTRNKACPIRPDNMPNRPYTVYTVSIEDERIGEPEPRIVAEYHPCEDDLMK